MANCLVTGGAGFIGSHVSEALLEADHSVVIFDSLSSGRRASLNRGIKLIKGDITDKIAIGSALRGMDYVFHQAAIVSVALSINEPKKTWEVNVEGTKNVLDGSLDAGVKKVIIASSAAVYGDSPPPLKETSPLGPISPYGESKLECERLARSYAERGLNTISLRYFNVYGPGQDPSSPYSGVVAKFLDLALKGKAPTIFGDGKQTRDLIYVQDVAKANLLAMDKGEGELNIGSGRPLSVNSLYSSIKSITGSKADPIHSPKREGDIVHSYADISKARALGFRPDFTLEAGLKETISRIKSIS